MTKNYLFLLLGLLLAACSSDDKDEQPILVTNVVMPASGTVFKPGEKVTIMAKGFQDNDEIMFDIRWPLQDEVLHEGYAKGGRGVITEKTATSITFPGSRTLACFYNGNLVTPLRSNDVFRKDFGGGWTGTQRFSALWYH
ncbi:DUF4784 domain-containing protein [Bacteroides thetaiotaomicron]|nr:DUF4784 domain-containing protein [Bacteroides thetaiotaomicron]